MQDPIYTRIETTPRPTLTAASGLVLLAAVGLWISELALTLLSASLSAQSAAANAVYYVPFVLLPAAVYMARHPGLGEGMRLNPPPLVPLLAVGLLAILSVYIASLLTAAWGMALDALGLRTLGAQDPPRDERSVMLSIIALAAMPAVCEELLFRGLVLSAWESRGTWFAIAVTAMLFALLHGNLYGIPAYLLVGVIAGFVTFALDSVYAGMVYHTVYNAACLVIPWLISGSDTSAEAAAADISILTIALNALTVLALAAMLLATLRSRAHLRGIVPIPRIHRPLSPRERIVLAGAILVMTVSTVIILVLSTFTGGAP